MRLTARLLVKGEGDTNTMREAVNADSLQSPLGCCVSILGAIIGAVAGIRWLWPFVTKLLLLPYPGTSADNRIGAEVSALLIAVVIGAMIRRSGRNTMITRRPSPVEQFRNPICLV
jgi:hypothetical protein